MALRSWVPKRAAAFGVRTTGEREGKATKGKGGRKRGRARGLGEGKGGERGRDLEREGEGEIWNKKGGKGLILSVLVYTK